eukprot:jgi/Picsp_1/1224/NSC_04705-R1_conserved hypothetical protein [Bifidobacterium gallicum DSM 20093]
MISGGEDMAPPLNRVDGSSVTPSSLGNPTRGEESVDLDVEEGLGDEQDENSGDLSSEEEEEDSVEEEDVPFESRTERLVDLLDQTKYQYCIHYYQRPYEWTKTNMEGFMDSIYNDVYAQGLKCVKIAEMFLFESNQIQNRKYVHVIDGQQRLISFSILYACIHLFLEDLKSQVDDEDVGQMADDELKILRARLQSKDEERISLILKKDREHGEQVNLHKILSEGFRQNLEQNYIAQVKRNKDRGIQNNTNLNYRENIVCCLQWIEENVIKGHGQSEDRAMSLMKFLNRLNRRVALRSFLNVNKEDSRVPVSIDDQVKAILITCLRDSNNVFTDETQATAASLWNECMSRLNWIVKVMAGKQSLKMLQCFGQKSTFLDKVQQEYSTATDAKIRENNLQEAQKIFRTGFFQCICILFDPAGVDYRSGESRETEAKIIDRFYKARVAREKTKAWDPHKYVTEDIEPTIRSFEVIFGREYQHCVDHSIALDNETNHLLNFLCFMDYKLWLPVLTMAIKKIREIGMADGNNMEGSDLMGLIKKATKQVIILCLRLKSHLSTGTKKLPGLFERVIDHISNSKSTSFIDNYEIISLCLKSNDEDSIKSFIVECAHELYSRKAEKRGSNQDIKLFPLALETKIRISENTEEIKFSTPVTLEHVLPLTLTDAWEKEGFSHEMHNHVSGILGNLTLLSDSENPACSASLFSIKSQKLFGEFFAHVTDNRVGIDGFLGANMEFWENWEKAIKEGKVPDGNCHHLYQKNTILFVPKRKPRKSARGGRNQSSTPRNKCLISIQEKIVSISDTPAKVFSREDLRLHEDIHMLGISMYQSFDTGSGITREYVGNHVGSFDNKNILVQCASHKNCNTDICSGKDPASPSDHKCPISNQVIKSMEWVVDHIDRRYTKGNSVGKKTSKIGPYRTMWIKDCTLSKKLRYVLNKLEEENTKNRCLTPMEIRTYLSSQNGLQLPPDYFSSNVTTGPWTEVNAEKVDFGSAAMVMLFHWDATVLKKIQDKGQEGLYCKIYFFNERTHFWLKGQITGYHLGIHNGKIRSNGSRTYAKFDLSKDAQEYLKKRNLSKLEPILPCCAVKQLTDEAYAQESDVSTASRKQVRIKKGPLKKLLRQVTQETNLSEDIKGIDDLFKTVEGALSDVLAMEEPHHPDMGEWHCTHCHKSVAYDSMAGNTVRHWIFDCQGEEFVKNRIDYPRFVEFQEQDKSLEEIFRCSTIQELKDTLEYVRKVLAEVGILEKPKNTKREREHDIQ